MDPEGLMIHLVVGLKELSNRLADNFTLANFLLVLFGILIFTLSSLFEYIYKKNNSTEMRNLFFVLYEFNVRQVYRSQFDETHETLFRGVDSVLRSGASRPAALLLLAAGRGARCTASSLAERVAHVVRATLAPAQGAQWQKFTLRGRDFTSSEDFWQFHGRLSAVMAKYRVAVLTDLEALHPQVATALCHVANDSFAPQGQAVLLMILDSGERFTQEEVTKKSPTSLGETAVRECLGPFLDREVVTELVRQVTWRTALVVNDPGHRPSLCPTCSPRSRA